jgi:RHS repeat-associated protein
MDDVAIIHMNGRLYSPSLGRMLSPDPVTFAPEDAQGYNRYSYVLNNPLRYTDPSGFSPSNDAQIQKVDPVKLPGPMSHVSVTASRVSSTASFFSGFTSSSLVLGSSGSTFPSSEPGDNMTDTGNPVAEVERDDTQSTRVCGENNLECTAPTTAENLQNTLANYQRFLQQVQMDQLFWEDLARRSGNAAVGFAGAGVFFSQVGVIGAGATVFAVVSIGALHFADEADKANVASAYLTTQQLIKVALNGVPILRNNPAAMNRVTQVFSYISGMTTIDIESN